MIVTGISKYDLNYAVDHISTVIYGGNLTIAEGINSLSVNRHRLRLKTNDSGAFGSRKSASGRRGPYACWHAYRDVMRAVFEVNPNARIQTGMAVYKGVNGFEDTYPSTGDINIGSMVAPAYMPELCSCEDD